MLAQPSSGESPPPEPPHEKRTTRPLRAIVSIHDVAPHTLPQTLELIALLESQGSRRATLLVVPGADWSQADLAVLRRLEDEGHELAAHGWHHRCEGITSWTHRLHSLVLSRDLAEHLSLDAPQIAALVTASHWWFPQVGLRPPELYVPPAWAMGPLRRETLRAMPFAMYESLTGVYHAETGRHRRLPLVGFEANTRWRRLTLRAINALNTTLARAWNRPLRIAVHPFDLTYHLADDLRTLLHRPLHFMRYAELDFAGR